MAEMVNHNLKHNSYVYILQSQFPSLVVVWLFLPETLKAKKRNPLIMTNDDDITSSNSMVTSDDDLEDEENQRLLRLPRHKKMLVCDK